MKNMSREQAWSHLQQQALVNGELPPAAAPFQLWYLRILQGFSAWIAALFLLFFIAVLLVKNLGTDQLHTDRLAVLRCGLCDLARRRQ